MASLFFDIDGTLVDRWGRIEESTKQGIRALKENGHRVYINSGRTRVYINHPELLEMPFDGLLCGCGTNIILDGKDVEYHQIDHDLLMQTLATFYEYGLPTILEGREKLYMDEDLICRDDYGKWLYQTYPDIIEPIMGNEANVECGKLSAATYQLNYKPVIEAWQHIYHFADHKGFAIEAIPKPYSKATAIQTVCRLTGTDRTDTYAFGDSVNDMEMLEYSGHGVVMGNGSPEAKSIADYVTEDIHEDGIFRALQHFKLI